MFISNWYCLSVETTVYLIALFKSYKVYINKFLNHNSRFYIFIKQLLLVCIMFYLFSPWFCNQAMFCFGWRSVYKQDSPHVYWYNKVCPGQDDGARHLRSYWHVKSDGDQMSCDLNPMLFSQEINSLRKLLFWPKHSDLCLGGLKLGKWSISILIILI